jgi:exopolyphosphatase
VARRLTLNSYLAETKNNITQYGSKQIVIGNEAADLDSMVSSIVHAYYLACKNRAINHYVAPIMPIPREDFKLRPEAVYVFAKAGIKLNDVLFFDEVDFPELMKGDARIVLVDHNKLSVSLEKYGYKVVGILDHHKDEKLYSHAPQKVIVPVGSTATLVAAELLATASDLIDINIAMLLIGTILLDTVNLDVEAGRVTPKDVKIVAELLKNFPIEQSEYFENIQREKFNVANLTTTDLLRKDYKEWNFGTVSCGIASVLLSVEQWGEKDNHLCQKFAAYAKTMSLDILLAMNAYKDPAFKRDIVLFCKYAATHDDVVIFLQQQGLELRELEMKDQETCTSGKISYYSQGNLGISRKKLQPMLDLFASDKFCLTSPPEHHQDCQ